MARVRIFLMLAFLAAGCALLIASAHREEQGALVLVGRHSTVPASARATSLASSSRSFLAAHSVSEVEFMDSILSAPL